MSLDRETATQRILALMCDGHSMRAACREAGVPNATFMGWVEASPALAEQYARARDSMIDAIADDTMAIADKEPSVMDSASVAKQRLQVDTRKWLLSKLAPKRYGDRIEVAGDPSAPLVHRITRRIVSPKEPSSGS